MDTFPDLPGPIYQARFTFLTPLLGTKPGDPHLATRFFAPQGEDELGPDPGDDVSSRNTTVFNRTAAGQPSLVSYQLLGALKESAIRFFM